MKWSNKPQATTMPPIDRRKDKVIRGLTMLAVGNSIVYILLLMTSGEPRLVESAWAGIPFALGMLALLRVSQFGRHEIARWALMLMIFLAVAIQVFAFHGTDIKTYFFFLAVAIAAPAILPWRHRAQMLVFVALNMILFVGLDLFGWHVTPELATVQFDWGGRLLNTWVRFATVATAVVFVWSMEYLTRCAELELHAFATTDLLTGLLNRRGAEAVLKRELVVASRRGSSLWVVMIDVDHFKHINDRFGHDIGDAVLRQVAQELLVQGREQDVIARWGGEEFLIAMLGCSGAKAAVAAVERMRASIAVREFAVANSRPQFVTISAGIARLSPDASFEAALEAADQAMYRAKSAGRNRIVVADELTDISERSATDAGPTKD